jgi:hypothetical protein
MGGRVYTLSMVCLTTTLPLYYPYDYDTFFLWTSIFMHALQKAVYLKSPDTVK